MKHIHTFESFLNEGAKSIDMSKVEIGSIVNGHEVSAITLMNYRDHLEIGTIMFDEANKIAKALNAGGFEAKAKKLPTYYNGSVEIQIPPSGDQAKKMAGIIEDVMGHHLVNDDEKRIRITGNL